jgi:protein-L-isoaspartate(D-aspartate) O-methyltransferase
MNRQKSSFLVGILAFFSLLLPACDQGTRSDVFDLQRHNMVRWDLKEQGIKSERVLAAMDRVPRHLFIESDHRNDAYSDSDLPISPYLTTPRPFVVAKVISLLNLTGNEKVLEVGTGRGYQAALLGELAKEVYTIEIVPEMARAAEETLKSLNYKNVSVRLGDGYQGWPEKAPFDAILVMASALEVPKPLLQQLAPGGRLVIPIGTEQSQSLVLYRKTSDGLQKESIMPVDLKPMEGKAAGRYW